MTDTGKRFAVIGNAYLRESFRQQGYNVDALVAAIEAEAVAAERARIRTALAECSLIAGATTFGPGDSPEVSLREVVRIARAALSPEPKP